MRVSLTALFGAIDASRHAKARAKALEAEARSHMKAAYDDARYPIKIDGFLESGDGSGYQKDVQNDN